MKLEEIYAQETGWEERLKLIEEMSIDVTPNIKEYQNDRQLRDSQVGNRKSKILSTGETVDVNKIAIPFQKHITRTAASFLLGKPVTITASDEYDIDNVLNWWEDLRMDSLLLQACEKAKAFTQSAILFRVVEGIEGETLKATLLNPEKGRLIPIWGSFEELDSFVYVTEITENEEEKTVYYIYNETEVTIVKQGDEIVAETALHGFDKMPVVYFEEEQVEWEDVKPMIDRFENRFSKFADTNDYFSSPFFKATGNIENAPKKDETGQVYMMDIIETDSGNIITSDLDVVSWDSAPEATKLEFELSKGLIYDLSSTPDLSFDNVKGMGNVSGVALKLMFLQAEMKSSYSQSIYKVGIRRTLNVLLSGLLAIGEEGAQQLKESAVFQVDFNSMLPENTQELISMLSEATLNKPVMSQRTAVSRNPLVSNPREEYDNIKSEESEELGGTLNEL